MALEWLAEIERRAEAATPGPWVYRPECYGVMVEGQDATICWGSPRDEEFIAHARTDVPKLCRAVRELAGALDRVLASQWFDLPDAMRDEANAVLERWRRGGEAE